MKSRIWLLASSVLIALSVSASAQSACPYPLQYGQVLTTAQWNACLSAGLNALPLTGGALSGPLSTTSATTASAGFTIPYGLVPTSPNPGDIYNSVSGLRVYDNGAWKLLIGTQTVSPTQGDIVYFDGTKWVDLPAGTSGFFLETLGPGANPPLQWANVAAGAGCSISGGAQYQIIVNNGASGCSTSTNALVNVGALSLGASGTLGSVKMGNATSGTVTLQPATGALGTVTATLPANTGTIAELNLAQTWTATQTLPNSGLLMLGSSTGATTFTSANAGPSNYTITVPATSDTLVTLAAGQSLTNKSISGSTNTLSNIGNGSLTNSSVTINGTSVSLGGSVTLSVPVILAYGNISTGSTLLLTQNLTAFSAYHRVVVEFENLTQSGSGYDLYARYSIDGGATWVSGSASYNWRRAQFGTSYLVDNAGSSNVISLCCVVPYNINSSKIDITGFDLGGMTYLSAQSITAITPGFNIGVGTAATTSNVNAVQFYWSGATSTGGTYRVIGYL